MSMVLYDELDYEYEDVDMMNVDFDDLFNNKDEGNHYVVCGTVGLWDGRREGHMNKVYESLYDAIVDANTGFNGYIKVSEGKYGKLLLDIYHHDGNNHLEIRELTKYGLELYDNYYDIGYIVNRKGATRNIKFSKKYF